MANVRLEPRFNPEYTLRHVHLLEKIGRTYYGMSQAEIDALVSMKAQLPIPRASRIDAEFFGIVHSKLGYVGDLTLSRDNEDSLELTILVFEEFWNKGIGRAAIAVAVDMAADRGLNLEASVRIGSPSKAQIIGMLTNAGFSHVLSFDSTAVYRIETGDEK